MGNARSVGTLYPDFGGAGSQNPPELRFRGRLDAECRSGVNPEVCRHSVGSLPERGAAEAEEPLIDIQFVSDVVAFDPEHVGKYLGQIHCVVYHSWLFRCSCFNPL